MKERKTGRNTGSMTGRKKERRRRASLIKEGHVPPLRILVSPVGGEGGGQEFHSVLQFSDS